MSKSARIIKDIRKMIPAFKCKPGCHECCGPVPFTSWEWSRVREKKELKSLDCQFCNNNGCEIYDERPIMCRLFGATEEKKLACPHGCGPDKKLTLEETCEIMDMYIAVMKLDDIKK
jgi:uncharacterized protein